jgi:hypothetical protein
MARIEIAVDIDESGAIRGVEGIKGETDQLDHSVRRVEKSGSRLGQIFQTAFGFIIAQAILKARQAVTQFLRSLQDLAMEIQDVDNSFTKMFQNAAKSASRVESNIRDTLALTQMEARKLITEIAGMGLAMRGTNKESLELAEGVSMLASQWERVAGIPLREGIEAVEQAMSGQFRSLRRRGIVLTEQRIAERALILTGKEHADQLRDIERAQATVALISEALGRQFGNLEGAGEGLTQMNRRLKLRFSETREELVRNLIPTMERLLRFTNNMFESNSELTDQIKTGLIVQLRAMDEILGAILNTFAGGEQNLGVVQIILKGIVDELNRMAVSSGRAIVGIATLLDNLPAPLRAGAAAFGLTSERIQEMQDAGARLIIAGTGMGKMIEDLKPPLEDADDGLEDIAVTIAEEVMPLTKELIEEWVKLGNTIEEPIKLDDTVDALMRARDVLLRYGDDGRVSILEMDEAMRSLNEELLQTADPERREGLVAMRERLKEIRDEAMGAEEAMDDWSVFLQTSLANALSSTLTEFTNLFEGIGSGAEKAGKAMTKSILAIIRGIGQQLIAWGTMRLIMSGGTDPRGWAAVAYGTTLASLSSLAMGSIKGGASGGGGGGTAQTAASSGRSFGGSVRTPSRNIVEPGLAAAFGSHLPEHIVFELSGKIEGSDILLSGQRTMRLRNRVGEK